MAGAALCRVPSHLRAYWLRHGVKGSHSRAAPALDPASKLSLYHHRSICMTMTLIEIDKALRQLRLSGVRATLETRILEAQAANLPFLETFSTILQDELDR